MPIQKSLLALTAGLALSSAPAVAQGSWLASYPEVQDSAHVQMRTMMQQDRMLEEMANQMNGVFQLRRDLTLELAECGTPAVTYDSRRTAIRICYEFFTALGEQEDRLDPEGAGSFENAFAFILLHQVGHALIDVLGLDVRMPPEEAADQFVAAMAGLAPGELTGLVDGVAVLQDLELDWETPDAGTTTLDSRRAAKLTCLLYGGDPETYGSLVEEGRLTSSRAKSCVSEYADVLATWTKLLEAHMVQG